MDAESKPLSLAERGEGGHDMDSSTTLHAAFHLAVPIADWTATQKFYMETIGNVTQKRCSVTTSSTDTPARIHLDFFGAQLELGVVEGYDGRKSEIGKRVDGNDVPVPHFGAALPLRMFHKIAERMVKDGVEFVLKPQPRYVGHPWEHWVMFIRDPSGNSIELKSFIHAKVGKWA